MSNGHNQSNNNWDNHNNGRTSYNNSTLGDCDLYSMMNKNGMEFINEVEKFASNLKLNTTQLRKMYEEIEKIKKGEGRIQIMKVRILLEYANNRGVLNKDRIYYNSMKKVLDKLILNDDGADYQKFKKLMEAVVAFKKK